MGGFFGVTSEDDCRGDLFFGTDYHSHLGTERGGLSILTSTGLDKSIKDIRNRPFREELRQFVERTPGKSGIGVISDYEDQPIVFKSPSLGEFAIVHVGRINNLLGLVDELDLPFSDVSRRGGSLEYNPVEVIGNVIGKRRSFFEGIQYVQEIVEGSCSLMLLTPWEIFLSRDRLGRTPVVVGKKQGTIAASLESCAFPNLDFEVEKELGAGEIGRITSKGYEQLQSPNQGMQICSFLWVYYGYPASTYEGINVENARYRCGAALAKADNAEIDVVAGIPDSGTGHAIGYANESRVPYQRPFVKYTPTWPRSFMPQSQERRDLVARMKLIPVRELIKGKRILFCEDSIVRGTQLKDTIQRLFDYGAREVHMRPACPPLIHGCKYLNFSQSKSELDLAARRAIREIDGDNPDLGVYTDETTPQYQEMVRRAERRFGLTSLRYQRLGALVDAIGLPKEKLCTYCWDGSTESKNCGRCK